MRGLRQSMENEAISQIPAIPVRVERYSPGRLRAPPEVVTLPQIEYNSEPSALDVAQKPGPSSGHVASSRLAPSSTGRKMKKNESNLENHSLFALLRIDRLYDPHPIAAAG